MAKEFKTIDELRSLLESRGVEMDEGSETALRRESYYAIVNGYKRPFLDTEAMVSTDEDVFVPGTKFSWIHSLFEFDRDLRHVTFKYLSRAEAMMKTSVVYAFCEANPAHDSYLDRSSYADRNEFLVPKGYRGNKASLYQDEMSGLMRILNGKISDRPGRKPFVSHYVEKYGSVPLWVLANDLTFGNLSHFYQLQKRSVQNRSCKLVLEAAGKLDGKTRITPQQLLHAFSVLSDFRNLCAHDERLYCSKVGKSGDVDYHQMAVILGTVLPKDVFNDYIKDVNGLFGRHEGSLHVVTPVSLLKDMGFTERKRR